MLPDLTPSDVLRFWSKVDKNGPIPPHCPELGPCWLWTDHIGRSGYGQIVIQGKTIRAHRVAYAQAAQLPDDRKAWACHVCDNRRCVRNDSEGFYAVNGLLLPRRGHIFVGTPLDNMADCRLKGRTVSGDRHGLRVHPGSAAHGERNGSAKLTAEKVLALRTDRANGASYSALAARYAVANMTVADIVHRRTWQHV